MIYTEKDIIERVNESKKISEIEKVIFNGHKYEQGILGNLHKINLIFKDPNNQILEAIYKSQFCSNKQNESNVYDLLYNYSISSMPQKYCDFDNGDIIIENLDHCKNIKITDGCNHKKAEKVLVEIAKIHSSFWGEKGIPTEDSSVFSGVLKYNLKENLKMYFELYNKSLKSIENDFIWLLENTETVSSILYDGKTLTHGDLHLENIMFGNNDKLYFIDWQLSSKRSPAYDLSFFLVQNLDPEIRKKYENELLEKYYNTLDSKIREKYSFNQLFLEYRACVTRSMMTSVMMIGKRFSHKKNQMQDADIMANRVIKAVEDLKPVEAILDLT